MIPHGKGTWTSSDKSLIKTGQFVRGKMSGQGESQDTTEKEKYIGSFADDKRDGYGHLFFTSNGGEHCGYFSEDKLHGYGLRVFTDGSWYVGKWENDQLIDGPVPLQSAPIGKASAAPNPSTPPTKVVNEERIGSVEYSGQVNSKGEPHGRGICVYADATRYTGQFLNGVRSGYGVITFSDGGKYDGEWKSDEKHGYGKEVDAMGNEYEGQFKTKKRHGQGVLKLKDGGGYDGEWKAGMMHGQGRLTTASSELYVGQMRDNLRHGKGDWTTKLRQYTGEWQNDAMQGTGKLTELKGDVYEGQYKNNLRHGKGDLTLHTGDQYSGLWQEGKMSGKGTQTESGGNVYVGQFHDGKRCGKGILKLSGGDVYDGTFENGLFHGPGKYVWKDGREFTGSFARDTRHGTGTFKWANGDRYVGQLENGRLHGEGVLTFNNGEVHHGLFAEHRVHGHGIRVMCDGSWTEGEWQDGKFEGDVVLQTAPCTVPSESNKRLQSVLGEKTAEMERDFRYRNKLWDATVPVAESKVDAKKKQYTAYKLVFRCIVTDEVFEKFMRYSELYDINQSFNSNFVKSHLFNLFPPKKVFGSNNPTFIESRREAIQTWLKEMVTETTIVQSSQFRDAFGIPASHEDSDNYKSRVEAVKQRLAEENTSIEKAKEEEEAKYTAEQVRLYLSHETEYLKFCETEASFLTAEDEWVKDELAKAESNIWEAPDTATAEPSPPNEAENTFDKSHSEFQPITTTLPILQDPFETLKDEDKIPVTNSNDNINTNRQSSYLPPLNASPPRPQRFSTTNVAKNDENDDTNNGNDTKPQETATTHEGEQSKRSYVDEALNNPFLGN
eukprot:c12152_g1_i2.p1 GENE.c12152_g1_i2~~c12152_g1_i2.p1  ORF type:complete len:876 (+),score=217.97 c12152_g1_i2:122-2629(+)